MLGLLFPIVAWILGTISYIQGDVTLYHYCILVLLVLCTANIIQIRERLIKNN